MFPVRDKNESNTATQNHKSTTTCREHMKLSDASVRFRHSSALEHATVAKAVIEEVIFRRMFLFEWLSFALYIRPAVRKQSTSEPTAQAR